MPDLIIHILGTFDRLRDLVGKNLAVPLPEPIDRGFGRRFRKSRALRRVSIRDIAAITEEEFLKPVEPTTSATSIELFAQAPQHRFKHCLCPASFEELVR